MYQVSNELKQMAKGIERQLGIKVVIDGVEYTNTTIVELDIENNLQQSEKFTLGSIISSRLNFTIRDFDVNPSENALVEPYIRFEGGLTWNEATQTWEQMEATWDFSNSEWLPLGKFYIDNRKYTNQRLWKFECYDKSMFMHQDFLSALEYPQSMRTVLQEACYQIDLEIENIELINPDYQIYLMPTELSIHQVISYIAAANCCSAFINRNGKLQFIKFGNSMYNNPVETLTMRDYFRARQTNDIRKYTKIRLFEKTEYTEGKFVEITRGTGDEFNTLDIENPFVDESILDDIYNSMKDFEYIPYELDYKCFPYLDLGDVITIEQSKGSTWLETKETWGTADFTWDYDIVSFNVIIFYNKIVYRGGLRSTLKAEAESVQTSEFKIKGSLREYVEQIDKSAIKEDVIYNGVRTSREEGVVVERSDGKAKTVMNATEGISIFSDVGQGLQRNFFVDLDGRIQARELDISGDATFQGTITASSVIGGTISGTTITGGSINIGSGNFVVNSNGDMVAKSGYFEGTIEASDIYGTYISGSTISGGSISGTTISGGTITGSTINTLQNATVGNNLYIGSMSNNFSKGIYFSSGTFESEISLNSSGMMSIFNWTDIDIYSTENIDITAVEDINIIGDTVDISCWAGGAVILDYETYVGYKDAIGDNLVATLGDIENAILTHIAEYH